MSEYLSSERTVSKIIKPLAQRGKKSNSDSQKNREVAYYFNLAQLCLLIAQDVGLSWVSLSLKK